MEYLGESETDMTLTTTTDWTRTVGDNDGGTANDVVSVDNVPLSTGEIGSGTYLEVDGIFTIPAGELPSGLDVWGYYNGGATHMIQILALNVTDGFYENIGVMPQTTVLQFYPCPLRTNHIDANRLVKIKFRHAGGSGNPSHVFHLDKVQVISDIPQTQQIAEAIGTRQPAEAYASLGEEPTYDQFLFMILQLLSDRGIVNGLQTTRKLDGAQPAMTHRLNDPRNPTDITRES